MEASLKILFIVPYAPTLIRVRPYQLIRSLAQQGHDLTLATLWTSEEERAALSQIAEHCGQVIMHRLSHWRVIGNMARSVCTPKPLQAAYAWQPELGQSIRSLLRERAFDVVHLEHLRGARYGLDAKATLAEQQRQTPVVWDSVDCITHLFQQAVEQSRSRKGRLMTQLDLGRTRRYEGWLVRQFDRVLVTSSTEKQALADLGQADAANTNLDKANVEAGHDRRLAVVANGVDLQYFTPQPGLQGEADLVFTGKMSYHANVTAALSLVQEIMPLVWAQRPDATVWIVGKEPPAEIRSLASRKGNQERVVVTGTVPDIRPFLHHATIAVAPILYGAGIQNKLLEAMASGTPVIASPQAMAGLPAQSSDSALVADGPAGFAAAIVRLLGDKAARIALGARGRCYVEEHHAWPNVVTQLAEIYQDAIAERERQAYACCL
ncbi:MAG: glycosyltransferase [Caldilineaceae bacterium]|nr:glycosyltransferase [Caldilineaceae bacterium]